MINNIFIFASLLLWSIVFHELGHLLFFRIVLKRNVKMVFKLGRAIEIGVNSDYAINKGYKFFLYFWGIFAGFIPILASGKLVLLTPYWNIALPILYFAGCVPDIKEMIKNG